MTATIFPAPVPPTVPVSGEAAAFPVRRIFCVGRNYAAHAAEMGVEVDREAPFYFTKSAFSLAGAGTLPYPPGTGDYHHEVELVVALGRPAFRIDPDEAMGCVWGYAVGLDMTRRDLQAVAKSKQRPWDLGKDVENSAVIGALTPAAAFQPGEQRITLHVNGEPRQDAPLSDMVWSIPELIADLSRYYHLQPGDLIYTGTPAGVGAVQPGDRLEARVEGLEPLDVAIGPAA
ncbi:fumarylacetoacetate hydrolase family protein [Paracoccus salipaludis]|uniref:fumarylacetoacetate hydrolase family protein n=1 Tax=Paracoccus salipaludis TaxID=2032623 RepID=UPI001F0A8BD3|nr:fumarylacetoacetate hydrolase family protein [Paracoccus salipaludis]